MMNTSLILTIKNEANDLFIDESKSVICPFCNASHERSFSLSRVKDGILYNCFRAKCGKHGFIPESGIRSYSKEDSTKEEPKYVIKFNMETMQVLQDYENRYGLSKQILSKYIAGTGYILNTMYLFFYVFNERGTRLGNKYVCKRIKGRGPKNYNLNLDDPKIYFPIVLNKGPILVVEDVLSCIKANQYVPCIALLGTNLSRDKISILSKLTKNLIIGLDRDATTKSFDYKNKYSVFFNTLDILILNKDIKDDLEDTWLNNLGETLGKTDIGNRN